MNNENTKLQFTRLIPDDVVKHEDLYINLLMRDGDRVPDSCCYEYFDYAANELQKAKEMFCKAFE